MSMTCVVVAQNEYARNTISESLSSLGVEAKMLNSLGELLGTLQQTPASGILLELVASIRASPQEKAATKDFLELYPFDKFKVTGTQVQMLGRLTLNKFVDDCQQFTPRLVRKEARHIKYLAVHSCENDTFEGAEKTVTANISKSGCFVFSIREWNVGQRIWMRFHAGNVLYVGTVRNQVPWGNNQYIPGIGIELDADETLE